MGVIKGEIETKGEIRNQSQNSKPEEEEVTRGQRKTGQPHGEQLQC